LKKISKYSVLHSFPERPRLLVLASEAIKPFNVAFYILQKGGTYVMSRFGLVDVERITAANSVRKDLGDIEKLAASIQELGLLHPVVITAGGVLKAGKRRLEACKRLGHKAIYANIDEAVENAVDLLKVQRDENSLRKELLPSEAVALARAFEEEEKKAAAQRAEEGRKRGGLIRQGSMVEIFHEPDGGKTRDRLASICGMSGRTLEKAKAIVEAAEQEPEKYSSFLEEMDRTERVDGVYKMLEKRKQAEAIAKEAPLFPEGPFRVIVADPPWHFEKRAEDPSQRGKVPYPTMTLEQIKALRVADIAHEDAILWLWTTNAHLPYAFGVIEAWGFDYKTCLTWVKNKMGTGDWLRGQTEHCLLAVRGNPAILLTNQTTALEAPVREHSEKPEEFYQLVEELCPGAKVDLFARKTRDGWAAFGDEVPGLAA
jgi:N6-adenosine-specific RNA methylase IME4/ParB-like chromosome segregation protein Spo0J